MSLVVFLGIFLRAYHFHDWLRFGGDQSRDAAIISDALKNKNPLPFLGPNAGNTNFLLGPMYYYFSFISEKIFGNNPVAMAYPSLIFSILAIPLLFLFLKEYFNKTLSLALTVLMSVSYFLVINSRFSSNPNLMPFFLLTYFYAMLKILNNRGKKNLLWVILIGISLGVGVQLHTTFLVIMPIVTFCVFVYLLIKKYPGIWKNLAIIIIISLIFNTSQIVSEFGSNWFNSRQFFAGFRSDSKTKGNLAMEAFYISACQVEANAYTLSSVGDDISCRNVFRSPLSRGNGEYLYYLEMTLGVLFSVTGYFLLWRNFRKTKELKKKNFLGLVLLFNLVTFIILVPIAKIIFVGYFLIIFLVPFVLFGLIIEAIQIGYGKIGRRIAVGMIFVLLSFSLIRDFTAAISYRDGLQDDAKNSTLGEVELMAQYVLATRGNSSSLFFSGETRIGPRFYLPVKYFLNQANIDAKFIKAINLDNSSQHSPLYYIENNNGKIIPGQAVKGHEIISGRQFSRQAILILK